MIDKSKFFTLPHYFVQLYMLLATLELPIPNVAVDKKHCQAAQRLGFSSFCGPSQFFEHAQSPFREYRLMGNDHARRTRRFSHTFRFGRSRRL